MKKINLKIQTQLQIGFAIIFLFVLMLGWMAWVQTEQIAAKTRDLYDHPLRVRRAIGKLTADVLEIRIGMKDLVFTSSSETQSAEIIGEIEIYQVDAFDQIAILASQYLGPQSDVALVKQEFIKWNAVRAESIRLLREGNLVEARARTLSGGAGRMQAHAVFDALRKIDAFSLNKGDALFAQSQSLNARLNLHLLFLLAAILLLAVAIGFFLMHNIRRPLGALTRATQAFQGGDLSARSTYTLKNEFGLLSDSFNHMAATVYLLSSDQKSFDHFASIGLDEGGRASFGADVFEGEFGAVLYGK